MQSLRENARILRRDRRKGVSLVIAMCASFLVFIFGFSVLFSVSALLRSKKDQLTRERCRVLAQSFADVLQAELLAGEGSFPGYVETVLEGEDRVSRSMASNEDGYGTLIVSIQKNEELEAELPSGSFAYGDTKTALKEIEAENSFLRRRFTLEVRSELEGESYTCKDPYLQMESFQPLFSLDGIPVYWSEGWYLDPGCTLPLEVEAGTIAYCYDGADRTCAAFLPTWGEGGAP